MGGKSGQVLCDRGVQRWMESGREQLVKPPLTAFTPLVATLGAVLLSLVLWKKKQEVTVKGIEVTYSEVR